MRDVILIAHNHRSTHNVGSLLRTAEGLGVSRVYLSGNTPYPAMANDDRLPHITAKLTAQIHKTALDAETLIAWDHTADVFGLIRNLRQAGYTVAALEQRSDARKLSDFDPPDKIAILVGREVEGIEAAVIAACDLTLEIPMLGRKESFNVVQAAAMALYHCRYP
jgi:tRNA G18 (ribose-2'-O)-methylase SpoU